MTQVKTASTAALPGPAEGGLLSDVNAKIDRAVSDELARRRRQGLAIVVDEGNGVEQLPFGAY